METKVCPNVLVKSRCCHWDWNIMEGPWLQHQRNLEIFVEESEAEQPQVWCQARAKKGPGEGGWEKNLGLDKALAGRTGTCQGGTRPAGRKKRASLGAGWRVGVNKMWDKGR